MHAPRRFALILFSLLGGFAGAACRADTVLITGATTGIGLEFARQYAARGWDVIATHHQKLTPNALKDLASHYPKVRTEQMDVSDQGEVDALAQKLKGEPIDVLINNAGLYAEGNGDPTTQSFGHFHFALLDQILAVNVKGPLMVTQAFYPNVKAGHQKKIICISSTNGSLTHSPPGTLGMFYRTSKAALNKEMQLVAIDLKTDGIMVLLIHPGVVRTEHFYEYSKKFGPFDATDSLDPPMAVGHMLTTIQRASIKDTGHFVLYDGSPLPW